jgi:hypothetical protein
VSELLNRFSLQAAKFNQQVFLCMFLIWCVLVICAVFSISSHEFSTRQRRLWLWVVIGVPLFGLLAYLPFSVRREDLPQILLLKLQKHRGPKKDTKFALSRGGSAD